MFPSSTRRDSGGRESEEGGGNLLKGSFLGDFPPAPQDRRKLAVMAPKSLQDRPKMAQEGPPSSDSSPLESLQVLLRNTPFAQEHPDLSRIYRARLGRLLAGLRDPEL